MWWLWYLVTLFNLHNCPGFWPIGIRNASCCGISTKCCQYVAHRHFFCCWLTRPLSVRTQLLESWITLFTCACDSNLSQLTRCTRFLCLLGPRSHVSGYFEPLNFFFPDTASVHIQASSEFGIKSGYFWLRNESDNVWTANSDIFESDDVAK